MDKKTNNGFYETCLNCKNHKNINEKSDAEPWFIVGDRTADKVPEHICLAQKDPVTGECKQLDIASVAYFNNNKALIFEKEVRRVRVNEDQQEEWAENEVPKDEQKYTAENSYELATFIGKNSPDYVDKEWAFDNRRYCGSLYYSIYQAEKDDMAKAARVALDEFMKAKVQPKTSRQLLDEFMDAIAAAAKEVK